ncbi:FlgO family outer membrane protein [Rheinheimera sp. 4Y26]|uniref:FlgO family outer membrane protein n=1 Tax=Rheinheimera sp. 4Y26 TaxID=2977811 RepID=UPI0021B129B6|nr:FlgO family outer membrane protein [Rheinheimera sp. 4Y26]MCT6700540.1 FlgO family outer membrane protein [Rheinheimera sp. 4Y26]
MRSIAVLLLLALSGCSQLCDCQNAQADRTDNRTDSHSEASLSEQMQQEQSLAGSSVATDGTVIEDKVMPEAPPVQSAPTVSQLDKIMAEPGAKPIWPVVQKAPLQRKNLPSEQQSAYQQGGPHSVTLSPYPELPQSRKQLTDYAAQLAFKLAGFDELKGAKVGITSFVEFDDSLEQTTALGNQFAEAMVTLLPQYGVDVIEYKLTRDIDVSPRGDVALSRDVLKLQQKVGMDYVMTGTLVATRRGIQINSRVVSVQGHKVIAAASTMVPHLVLQQIQP